MYSLYKLDNWTHVESFNHASSSMISLLTKKKRREEKNDDEWRAIIKWIGLNYKVNIFFCLKTSFFFFFYISNLCQ